MVQHGSEEDKTRRSRTQPRQGRTAPGSRGERGQRGEQYQPKDMGAHPAHGKEPRNPDGKEEDYGARGLHRRAGTTKREGIEERGIGHAEDYDARYDEDSSKVGGQSEPVTKNQSVREREAARGKPSDGKIGSRGFKEVEDDTADETGDLDISPGASGGSKRSKRDPASR